MGQRYDVMAVGNAIVDIIASVEDSFLERHGFTKGAMRLATAEQAKAVYDELAAAREISGGSAANSMAGLAALGVRCAFVGRVSDDQLGRVFRKDIRALGVDFDTAPATGGLPTAQCVVMVTPDTQRTMLTYLGSSAALSEADIDEAVVRASRICYFEGYLWDQPEPIGAIRKVAAIAKANGRQTALTLSDVFCVDRHRQDFLGLMSGGLDLVFANENEAKALFETDRLDDAIEALAERVPLAVVTRSEKGAIVVNGAQRIEVPATPVARVIDTTGAGDLFASGFLAGLSHGRPLRECALMGTVAAAEVIKYYGARPETDLSASVMAALA